MAATKITGCQNASTSVSRAIKQSLCIGIFLTRGNVQGNEALSTLGQGDGV